MATPQELTAATQRALQDPAVQQALQRWITNVKGRGGVISGHHGVAQEEIEFNRAASRYLPKGTHIVADPRSGQASIKNDGVPSWIYPLAAFGAGVGGAAALGAFSGAGGGASAAGSLGGAALPPAVSESASAYPFLAAGGAGAGGSVASQAARGATAGATGTLADKGINAAVAGLAGLPALFGNRGPSSQEQDLTAQVQRLLSQQESRTQYADPLYKAAIQMAYGLLPNRPGNYPGGS